MIDLYYWTTPNGHKITIFLEETGLPYTIKPVNIAQGRAVRSGVPRDLAEQPHPGDRRSRAGRRRRAAVAVRVGRDPARISPARPAASIPTDLRGRCECAAVAVLADGRASGRWPGRTTTSRSTRRRRSRTRSTATCGRPGGSTRVLNKRLADREFIAGDYSIADMACYPWIQPERQGQDIDDFPHLTRWNAAITARPAVRARLRAREGDQRRRRRSPTTRRGRSCSGRTRTRCADEPARGTVAGPADRPAPASSLAHARDDAKPAVPARLDHRGISPSAR